MVTCLGVHSFADGGEANIIVGRDDGSVEVMVLSDSEEYPEVVFTTKMASGITSVLGGHVLSPETSELIITTYAGEVVSFKLGRQVEDMRAPLELLKEQAAATEALRAEVAVLESELVVTRARFAEKAKAGGPDVGGALAPIDIRDSFRLVEEDASYHLTIELPVTIEMIVLQSDMPVDVIEVKDSPAVVRSENNFNPTTGSALGLSYFLFLYPSEYRASRI